RTSSAPCRLCERPVDRLVQPPQKLRSLLLGRRVEVRLRVRAAPLDLMRDRVGDRPRLARVADAELAPDPTLQRLRIGPRPGRKSVLDRGGIVEIRADAVVEAGRLFLGRDAVR